MEHLEVKAAVEVEEQGAFSALASAFGKIDRTGERVVKGAFAETIRRWQRAGRDVPLVWDHGTGAHDVIGSVASASMEERDAGLYVEGTLDIEDSELAREAWRSVRRNRLSLSFGFLTEEERTGADGVKELTRIDLMEVTLTVVPANPSAQVLDWKSATATAELTPEQAGILTDLRAEWEARRAEEEAEQWEPLGDRRWTPPRTRLVFADGQWRQVPETSSDFVATDAEIRARDQRLRDKEWATREIDRARAAKAAQASATVACAGFRIRVDDHAIVE